MQLYLFIANRALRFIHTTEFSKFISVLKIAGLHYVMLRPDNTYMDPADGITYTDFSSMNNSWLKSYTDNSICILLERS